MDGFNDDWINLGTKREITFTNLDPVPVHFKCKRQQQRRQMESSNYFFNHCRPPAWW
ncbi:MAG: hypothetical protein H6573_20450 [Lewinellaceae bacterium]|nr:hypothetical protein [Lewinellaceae bacterium]